MHPHPECHGHQIHPLQVSLCLHCKANGTRLGGRGPKWEVNEPFCPLPRPIPYPAFAVPTEEILKPGSSFVTG